MRVYIQIPVFCPEPYTHNVLPIALWHRGFGPRVAYSVLPIASYIKSFGPRVAHSVLPIALYIIYKELRS
jgi:hypothetical protein